MGGLNAKPFAESCEENKAPILQVLRRLFADTGSVLEVGSGTGQHAVHFAAAMPHLTWQTSDLTTNHAGIRIWLEEVRLENLLLPLALDVGGDWPPGPYEAVFSANTCHIISWPRVEALFTGVAGVLSPGGLFVLYGPFNYQGHYTSDSNRRFDEWLRARDPLSGIRNFESLRELGEHRGLELVEDVEMPVNNRILVWRRQPQSHSVGDGIIPSVVSDS